jgi:hypothetical protein
MPLAVRAAFTRAKAKSGLKRSITHTAFLCPMPNDIEVQTSSIFAVAPLPAWTQNPNFDSSAPGSLAYALNQCRYWRHRNSNDGSGHFVNDLQDATTLHPSTATDYTGPFTYFFSYTFTYSPPSIPGTGYHIGDTITMTVGGQTLNGTVTGFNPAGGTGLDIRYITFSPALSTYSWSTRPVPPVEGGVGLAAATALFAVSGGHGSGAQLPLAFIGVGDTWAHGYNAGSESYTLYDEYTATTIQTVLASLRSAMAGFNWTNLWNGTNTLIDTFTGSGAQCVGGYARYAYPLDGLSTGNSGVKAFVGYANQVAFADQTGLGNAPPAGYDWRNDLDAWFTARGCPAYDGNIYPVGSGQFGSGPPGIGTTTLTGGSANILGGPGWSGASVLSGNAGGITFAGGANHGLTMNWGQLKPNAPVSYAIVDVAQIIPGQAGAPDNLVAIVSTGTLAAHQVLDVPPPAIATSLPCASNGYGISGASRYVVLGDTVPRQYWIPGYTLTSWGIYVGYTGSGYTVGQILTIGGSGGDLPAQIKVLSIGSGGSIADFQVLQPYYNGRVVCQYASMPGSSLDARHSVWADAGGAEFELGWILTQYTSAL